MNQVIIERLKDTLHGSRSRRGLLWGTVLTAAALAPLDTTAGKRHKKRKKKKRCQAGFTKIGSTLCVRSWGKLGTGNAAGELSGPRGIARNANGDLFVVDSGNHRVVRFNASGAQNTEWGGQGSLPGQFKSPRDAAVAPNGNIYVTDHINDRVQVFTPAGAFQFAFGNTGAGDGDFDGPEGIAIDSLGNVFVSEQNNHRVQKFDANGNHLQTIGGQGNQKGKFVIPQGVAVDDQGNLYVADSGNNRIQKFDSNGAFLDEIKNPGGGVGNLDKPHAVAVDGGSQTGPTLYIGDLQDRVVIIPAAGEARVVGNSGIGLGQFSSLSGLVVTQPGQFVTVEVSGHRVQHFGAPPRRRK